MNAAALRTFALRRIYLFLNSRVQCYILFLLFATLIDWVLH